jgi:type I restriction enzyme, S subunit
VKRRQNMATDAKSTLTPMLRFPEFRYGPAWEGKELHSIADPVSERADNEGENNILTLSAEHGLVLQSEYFGKQIAGNNSDRYLRIQRDDFVYNDRTTKACEYGTIKRLTKHPHGIVSPIYKCFRFREGELPGFWEWYFESGAHDAQLHRLANEGARAGRFNVSIDRFLSTNVCAPHTNSAEQQKIAECLSTLDELIEAESQKLDAFKCHKKGLMQQLLPREGEIIPRLRFPEFQNSEEWVRKSFSELCDIKHGYAFEGEFFSNEGDYVLLTPGNFYEEGGYRDRGGKQKYYTGEIPRDYVLNYGDLLVAMTEQAAGLLGSPILVAESDKFLHNQRLGLVTKRPGVAWTNEFFFYVFNSQPVRKAIHASASGAKVRHTSPKKIAEVAVSFPSSLPEQHRIATCLFSLDELITAQSDRLSALNAHKQGLMQQLFPLVVETVA